MAVTQPTLHNIEFEAIKPTLGDNHLAFIEQLPGASFMQVPGRDRTRRKMIVTLLHANEPSGLKAIHRILTESHVPATDIGIVIASVDAAITDPPFSHRYLPGERDLNRCFALEDNSNQAQLAQSILAAIRRFEPEVVIDTHNTSSHSEPFCVARHRNDDIDRIAAGFADRLIVIRQTLGTLMEHSTDNMPIITTEFGGFMDPGADELAYRSLLNTWTDITEAASPTDALEHPLRLETHRTLRVSYSSSLDESSDLTILNTIDQLNFKRVPAGTTLGWYREHTHQHLIASHEGENRFFEHFAESHDTLITRTPMTIFMATTDPLVANSDCLFYFVS